MNSVKLKSIVWIIKLKKSKQKIKLKIQKLENDIYYSDKIIEFDKINGETFF